MQMLDNLIDTLHARYADTFSGAAHTATCHWERLMNRLQNIEEAIGDNGDTVLRVPFVTPLAANPQPPTRMRTLRTGESLEVETVTVDGNAGLLTILRDGVVVYAKTYTAADTRPGENLIIQGPGEVSINTVNACNLYLQCKFIALPDLPQPRRSRAGEQSIGVDPRENPGAADQGRHSLMQPTMIGASKIVH